MVNLKKLIADNKLKDAEIEKALMDFLKAKVAESQSTTSTKEIGEAEEQVAQEPAQIEQKPDVAAPDKEFFTQKELDELIAKKVEEKLKSTKIQDNEALQVPTFVNKSPPVAYRVLKMKLEN